MQNLKPTLNIQNQNLKFKSSPTDCMCAKDYGVYYLETLLSRSKYTPTTHLKDFIFLWISANLINNNKM